jgi:hypothetical protein
MKFNVLQLVEMIVDEEGAEKVVVGRVCKKIPPGFYCVKFDFGCLKVAEDDLKGSNEGGGPLCDPACNAGC